MVATFMDIYNYLTNKKITPKLHVIDNGCSKSVEEFIKDNQTKMQLVEPHQHCVNATK